MVSKALPDTAVPLAEKDAVFVVGVDKPYILHPFSKRREEVDAPGGPLAAMVSPVPESPWVVLQSETACALFNWKTKKSTGLTETPLSGMRFPVSWSADGRTIAFAVAESPNPVPIPRLIDQQWEFTRGEIGTLTLEDAK